MADMGSALASILQVPGLQELLNQSITQQRQQAPLRTAVNQQAMNMLPNSAFPGQPASGLGTRQNLGAIPQANFSTPAPSGGISMGTLLPLLAAGLGGAGALAKGANGSGGKLPIQELIDALRNRFGKGPSVQGNQNSVPNLTYDNSSFNGWAPFGNDLGTANQVDNSFTGWQPNLRSDPGVFTGMQVPQDPTGGTGVGPGMSAYYSGEGGYGGTGSANGGAE